MLNIKLAMLMIALSLVITGAVLALETKKSEIIVKTEPDQNLSITVLDPETNEELQTFTGRARKFGEYRFTYYGVISRISLSASIINNETQEIILNKKFGPYILGNAITINLTLAQPPEASLNTSAANVSSQISGSVVGGDGKFSNTYYYVAAGVLLVIILLIVFKRRVFTAQAPVEPDPKKIKAEKKSTSKTEVTVQPQAKQTSNQASIGETEKRISDLQKQLEEIRGEEKLARLKKQIAREQQELKRLQTEDDSDNNNKNQVSQSSTQISKDDNPEFH